MRFTATRAKTLATSLLIVTAGLGLAACSELRFERLDHSGHQPDRGQDQRRRCCHAQR